MPTYLKQPIDLKVEARQFSKLAQAENLAKWAGGNTDGETITFPHAYRHPRVDDWTAYVGDWIIQEDAPLAMDGKVIGDPLFYVCTDEQFRATFTKTKSPT